MGLKTKKIICTLDENAFLETDKFEQNVLKELITEDECENYYRIFKNNKIN